MQGPEQFRSLMFEACITLDSLFSCLTSFRASDPKGHIVHVDRRRARQEEDIAMLIPLTAGTIGSNVSLLFSALRRLEGLTNRSS